MQTFVVEKNQAGQRLDKFLVKFFPGTTQGFLYKMLRKKNITLNGKKAEGKEILALDDQIQFFFKDETFALFRGTTNDNDAKIKEYELAFKKLSGIQVIYEDENVIFLNKPQGILSQKAEDNDISINEWLIGYLLQTNKLTEVELQTFKPSICNRLDRNTSGLVLCGKSLIGSQTLSKLLKERDLIKLYHAIVCGNTPEQLSLDGYLTKNHKTNKVTYSKNSGEEYIRTDYKRLAAGKEFSLLEVHLITGKTHQIRAHLASAGTPILGDFKYGNRRINEGYPQVKYQLLHAYKIQFPDVLCELPNLAGKSFIAEYPSIFEEIRKEL